MSMIRCSYCHARLLRNLKISEIVGLAKSIPLICEDCAALFQLLDHQKGCEGCQKNMDSGNSFCRDCLEWEKRYPAYDFRHRAFFEYDSSFREWLTRYKFMGDIRLAGTFAKQWQKLLLEFPEYVICPIPLSKERMKERGFNQVSEMLALAKISYKCLLIRTKHLSPQAQKTREARLASAQPFELAIDPVEIRRKKILLVDDVYTTGQTLFHAADCLLPYSPEKIRTFSLAR